MNGLQVCKTCRLFKRCMKLMLKNPLYVTFDCRRESQEIMNTYDTLMEAVDNRTKVKI